MTNETHKSFFVIILIIVEFIFQSWWWVLQGKLFKIKVPIQTLTFHVVSKSRLPSFMFDILKPLIVYFHSAVFVIFPEAKLPPRDNYGDILPTISVMEAVFGGLP